MFQSMLKMWQTFNATEGCLVLQERIIPVTNIMTNEVLTRAAHRADRRYIFCTASHFSNFISNINLETKQEAVSECNVFHSTGLRKTLRQNAGVCEARKDNFSYAIYSRERVCNICKSTNKFTRTSPFIKKENTSTCCVTNTKGLC